MSHPARLSLRAPPHLPFIQGFPGVPGGKDRKQAAICGTVEVRVGAQPIKAKWVRVEIRKHESLPPGFPGSGTGDTWELVGEIMTLWQAPGTAGKEFDNLQTADFKFFLPLPETIPPTVEMMKGTGVWYELVAALSYRKKGGIFKSDSANIMKISEPIRITKHELHAVWPVYNKPDQKAVTGQDLTMTIARPGVAFGPGDRLLLTATLRSARPTPFKLRGFECTLLEVVTAIPEQVSKDPKRKSKAPSQPVVKSRPIAQARCAVDESLGRGGEKSARIDMAAPADLLVTVRHAKTLEVGYELQVKAVCEGFEGPVVPGIRYVVGPYARSSAQQAVKDIGHVDQLCGARRVSRPTSPSSGLSTPPNGNLTPSNQGFVADDPRRQSTSTITTTTTQDRFAEFSPSPGQRPYSTVPARQTLLFPTAHPAPGLQRSASTTISDYSVTPDLTSDSAFNRFSTATTGTFGVGWDRSIQTNGETKAPWDTAEKEKMALFSTARHTAATTQSTTGVPLERLGLADVPDVAPPEYAPPVPAMPAGKYQPPARPMSAYTSPEQSISSAMASPEIGSPISPTPGPSGGVESPGEYIPSRSVRQAVDAGPAPAMTSGPSSPAPALATGTGGLSEKEQMRRYYEARDKVDKRSASGSGSGPAADSGSGAGSGSGSESVNTQGTAPQATPALSALNEKEQMRRYYEARDRVGSQSGLGIGSASTASASSGAVAPVAPSIPAAGLSEKEQMRRYHEARDRAGDVRMGLGQGSTSGSSPQLGPAASSGSSGLSEKEQMRRYYEARDRAEQAHQGSSGPGSGSGSGSGMSSALAPPILPAGSPAAPLASTPVSLPAASSVPLGSPDERFATDAPRYQPRAMATLPSSSTRPPASPPSFSSAGPSRPPPPLPPAAASRAPYESASDEKERMRRLYDDANQRVSRAHGLASPQPQAEPSSSRVISASPIPDGMSPTFGQFGSPPIPPDSPGPPQFSISPPPPAPYSGYQTSSPVPTTSFSTPAPSGSSRTSPSAYPTAEQEKEAMRRRFEDASSAVTRSRLASPSLEQAPAFSSISGPSRSALDPPSQAAGADAPPPPLPSRPPADYINLLSPAADSPPRSFIR